MRKHSVRLLFLILMFICITSFANPGDRPGTSNIGTDEFMSNNEIGGKVQSLELVGVGVSIETFRNHVNWPDANLWKAVEASNGAYAISQKENNYPKNMAEWRMMSSKRHGDTIDMAMRDFMDRYPLPMVIVGPAWGAPTTNEGRDKSRKSNASSFVMTRRTEAYTSPGEFAGLLTQSGQVMDSYLRHEPDVLWDTMFATFDKHGDIPAAGVAVKDGAMHRALFFYDSDKSLYEQLAAEQVFRPKHAKLISDSYTFITMVRRGRIDHLRKLAPFVDDTMQVKRFADGSLGRNWSEFNEWKRPPPQQFEATPYISKPWTEFQIDQYDHLENLGTIFRPEVISFLNDKAQPLNTTERNRKMEGALRAVLAPLGGRLPLRIFYDYGSVWDDRTSPTRFLPFVHALHVIDESFDLLNPKLGYDLSRILGDTGAGSPFIAVALASMAGRQSGGATLIANLRRNDGATLMLVMPPSAEQMKKDAAIKRPYFPTTKNIKDVK